MRSSVSRRAALLAFVVVLALAPAAAGAEPFGDIPSMRAEAERLEAVPPRGVPPGALTSILYLLQVADEHKGDDTPNARRYLRNAVRLLDRARAGVDPFRDERGFVIRAYRSRTSTELQPYSVYVPASYTPDDDPRPMLVGLHGGASNHALYLGVALGNGIPWNQYRTRHRDLFVPQWQTESFVVAVEGMGHAMYRWMAERDIHDVIKDVSVHYAIDQDRITLNGLSNGGVGCYGVGSRNAWRFNSVVCASSSPSWILYSVQPDLTPVDVHLMSAYGALEQADNLTNTALEFFHGRKDPGVMRFAYTQTFAQRLRELHIPFTFHDLENKGHDLIDIVHARGALEARLAKLRRDRSPHEIRLVSHDLRAARQHWLGLRGFERYGVQARAHARVDGDRVEIETHNATELLLQLPDVPGEGDERRFVIDGDALTMRLGALGLVRRVSGRWRAHDDSRDTQGLRKVPGLAGPLTDAYFDPTVYVYGTRDPASRAKLQEAARFAARGWPLWLYGFRAPVMAEDEVTDEILRTRNVVLFGTLATSSLLARAAPDLPIRVEERAIVLRDRRLRAPDVGVRMIVPNPLGGRYRYLVVQTGNSVAAVEAGNRLPDFVPDYVVYDGRSTESRPRLAFGRQAPLEYGFFDAWWHLQAPDAPGVSRRRDP